MINLEASFKLDFTQLYNRLCATTHEKLSMLLLYTLMHNNCGFRNFVLSRTNLENLVVPVVKVLCDGISGSVGAFRANSHHTYLSLIVLLILSEDDFFCKIVHETVSNFVLIKAKNFKNKFVFTKRKTNCETTFVLPITKQ